MIEFEQIKAWDGVSDTGKDARLKLDRNFTKVKDKFSEIDLAIEEENDSRSEADNQLQQNIDELSQQVDEAFTEEENARKNEDDRRFTVCNLDVIIPLSSGFYTLQTAIEAATGSTALSGRITPGFELRFKTSASVVHSFIYNGGDKYDTLSWKSNIVEVEKTARINADNDLRLELFFESIGSVHPQAQDKPTPPTTRRYRFTVSGDCIFEGVTFENTGTEMEVPFPVLKDDELLVTVFGDQYFYKFFQNASKEMVARTDADNALQVSIDNLSGEIGSESLARTAGDNALQASIDQEISDRQTEIQGVIQIVNSNTEEIENEITNRTQTVNALRNELLSKTIGSIETGAEQKPAEGVSRRYRFTNDGNCYFTDVLNGLTSDVMPVPFVVSKDDELSVIQYGENYIYRYHKIASNYATKVEIGGIETALDNIHTAMTAVIMEMEAL